VTEKITIIVNGFPERVPKGSTVAQVMEMIGEAGVDLITEVNGRFVHPRDYAKVTVSEGSVLEFIHPAFGG
jgi:thiamine biosynthesis protein ThiS